jgi:hypothetical protein
MNDKECKELSKMVIECSTNMAWIKQRLEKGDTSFTELNKKLSKLETEHSLMKGKLGAFILGLTFFLTLVINSILWGISHLSGGK